MTKQKTLLSQIVSVDDTVYQQTNCDVRIIPASESIRPLFVNLVACGGVLSVQWNGVFKPVAIRTTVHKELPVQTKSPHLRLPKYNITKDGVLFTTATGSNRKSDDFEVE